MPGRQHTQQIRHLLLDRGLATVETLEHASRAAAEAHRTIQEELTTSLAVPEAEMLNVLAEVYGVPSANLELILRDPHAISSLPRKVAYELQAAPLFQVGNQLTIAMVDPTQLGEIDELQFVAGFEVLPVVVLPQHLRDYLDEAYGPEPLNVDEIEHTESPEALETPVEDASNETRETEAEESTSPVVRLVNLILTQAVKDGATDIHIEPHEDELAVRFRIDGRLTKKNYGIPTDIARSIVARIKVLSKLDISIQRRPQDGKIRLTYLDRAIDLRVSTFPTIRGEKVVLRVLDKERTNFTLDSIGLSDTILERWKQVMRTSEGIILVTGPTGSGKSSTLFATLRALNEPEVNIVTLEDPVEYELDGISQGQVDDRAGFSFAGGLRSILRQDPDIILVGEIRDGETAGIAVQAALTGHLVLASLHANDAPSAVARLSDLGVPNYLLSAALLGVMAQRLIRRNCRKCGAIELLEPSVSKLLGPWAEPLQGHAYRGHGCSNCTKGYSGRTAIHELLTTDPEVATLITNGAARAEIADAGARGDYSSMWHDAIEKVQSGQISIDEMVRVLDVPHKGPSALPLELTEAEASASIAHS